jgi:hypothetical protein
MGMVGGLWQSVHSRVLRQAQHGDGFSNLPHAERVKGPHPKRLRCLLPEPTNVLILSLSKDAALSSKLFATRYKAPLLGAWNMIPASFDTLRMGEIERATTVPDTASSSILSVSKEPILTLSKHAQPAICQAFHNRSA